jgi:ABC-type uncharacterized transport system permease subunit
MAKVPKMIKPPVGEIYYQIEGAKGILGYYIVSDGSTKPSRVHIHAPSFVNIGVIPEVAKDIMIQDFVSLLASLDIVQPAVEIFVGIPSVVYGWIGLTVLVPFIQKLFKLPFGFSVMAAGIVLAVMIFPSITSVAADAIKGVPDKYRQAAYGLGSTRW